MSTTSPILLLSRSTMTRPSQPRAVSMLGVAMLASFLVGTSVGLLSAVALHVTDASRRNSFPPQPSVPAATAGNPGWPQLGGPRRQADQRRAPGLVVPL